ncbi:FkbM family methyltransferase [Kiritimatiellaeota bacterium B1221]|nr:FkbM family methyltransferase [Kiritimatiellaeota bacterium B1221]
MIHENPFISAFIRIPEFSWKNPLRHWLATSPWVPDFIQDFSPIKGYEQYRQLQPGDVVIDAGAFPGDYTLFAAKKVGPTGKVIALEPEEKNRNILKRNLHLAGSSNVQVIPKGLWHVSTTLQMNQQGVASRITEKEPECRIEVIPLDQLVEELKLEKIHVLKMDIEGAELQALAGAQKTLSKFKPYTCIASYHIVDGTTTADRVEALLQQAGLQTHTHYPKHLTTYGCKETLF